MGSHTIAYTVTSFLKILTTLKTPSPSVVRWLADLHLYNYEVRHIPGSTNTAADALSRMKNLYPFHPIQKNPSIISIQKNL